MRRSILPRRVGEEILLSKQRLNWKGYSSDEVVNYDNSVPLIDEQDINRYTPEDNSDHNDGNYNYS